MKPTLKEELEFAVWKITGLPLEFSQYTIPYISQELSKKTGEDPAIISFKLIDEIKSIIHEDINHQLKIKKHLDV
jgi:hypothetical protein